VAKAPTPVGPRLVAFLRAINVGGHVVKMDVLRELFTGLGLTDVETFIASGNVLFRWGSDDRPALERKLEARLREALGYEVKTFVRTEAEVAAIARYRPFPEPEIESARAFSVGFLAERPTPAARMLVLAQKTDVDTFHVNGREVYWLCRVGQSDSEFSNVRFEKKVGLSVTFRGLKTITRLVAKYGT